MGISHCTSFAYRLYPKQDSTLNESFAEELYLTCPSSTTVNTTNLDIRTPNLFDNKYYVNLENGEVLFAFDESLSTDSRSSEIVASFATNETLFFERFVAAMVKMVQLDDAVAGECPFCGELMIKEVSLRSIMPEEIEHVMSSLLFAVLWNTDLLFISLSHDSSSTGFIDCYNGHQ
ncbi:hypothetical protein SUGI_0083130 [Cryptomeria japonica]|uniref:peroxidase 12-like n=1 Tax=Cryptomeria japonica TaxID=3369 RepID=UPI002408D040|nr:peroxidase 12-like [Cryptomeria japonica]GLJ08180.1 hypothetical protein SUGI_0083130 [Cryptomeria japonica]